MSNYEMMLLREMVDLSWELREEVEYNEVVKKCILERYWNVREKLEDEMGKEKFKKFMEDGKKMFS